MSRVGNYVNKINFHSILIFNPQYWNQKVALALIAHKIFFFRKTNLCDNEVPAFWNSKVSPILKTFLNKKLFSVSIKTCISCFNYFVKLFAF